jgi:hypothetical protein
MSAADTTPACDETSAMALWFLAFLFVQAAG